MSGKLEKIRVEAYNNRTLTDPSKATLKFEAMFNPESITEDLSFNYRLSRAIGNTQRDCYFSGIGPQHYTFKFLIDGTGANNGSSLADITEVYVDEQVALFQDVVVNRDIENKKSRFLKLVWGPFIRSVVFKKGSINYQMFGRAGNPIRAEIEATFETFDDT